MLGRRENPGEHEAMRKMKNECMVNWDGLRTKDKERVLVLAATKRPFDLDEAVIRRLPRRLMLAKEELPSNIDLEAIANMTEGYSRSDLKEMTLAASRVDTKTHAHTCTRRSHLQKKVKGRDFDHNTKGQNRKFNPTANGLPFSIDTITHTFPTAASVRERQREGGGLRIFFE